MQANLRLTRSGGFVAYRACEISGGILPADFGWQVPLRGAAKPVREGFASVSGISILAHSGQRSDAITSRRDAPGFNCRPTLWRDLLTNARTTAFHPAVAIIPSGDL